MAISRTQRSFTAGEIAPDLYGRSDLVKFATGLATCRNFIVRAHGGVINRPGFGFVAEIKDSSARSYFAKYVYSAEETFILEIGNLYFRFVAQGAVVGDPYELETPYLTADLSELRFEQSENVVTITHKNYAPRELRRVSDTEWTLTAIATAPTIDAPGNFAWTPGAGSAFEYRYQVTAVRADDYEESLPCDAVAHDCNQPTVIAPNGLSWDPVDGAVEYNVYLSRDGNAFGFIATTTNTAFYDSGLMPQLDEPPPIARELFSSAGNYPKTSGHIQQRRGFGATTNEPKKTWLSRTGREFNFAVSSPLQDDDAVTFEIKASRVNEVRHILEIGEQPLIGTAGGWWFLRGDDTGAVTPATIYPKRLTAHGPSALPPAIVGDGMVYLQDRGKIVRELRLSGDGLSSGDLTLFAPHLLRAFSIERFDYAEFPDSVLWAVRSDGTLLSMTYNPEQQVVGWARHDTDGVFEDVCVVPEGDEDGVYVIVRRTIDGQTKRYIERLASREFSDIRDFAGVDSFLSYDGEPADELEGLDHLEGKTVSILADGNVHAQQVVSGGAIALDGEYSKVHVGLPITADIETLDLDIAELELRDRKKKLGSVSILVQSSRGIFAGLDAEHLTEYPATFSAYDVPPGLLTGIVEIDFTSEWQPGARVLVRQTDPLPLNILAIVPNGEVGG